MGLSVTTQCGGSAELRALFVPPRVAVGSAAGDLLAGGCPPGPPQPALEASPTPLRSPEHTSAFQPQAFAWARPTLGTHAPLHWLVFLSTESLWSRLSHRAPGTLL